MNSQEEGKGRRISVRVGFLWGTSGMSLVSRKLYTKLGQNL